MIYLIGTGLERGIVNYVYLSDREGSGGIFVRYHDQVLDACEGDALDIAIMNLYSYCKTEYFGSYSDRYCRPVHVFGYFCGDSDMGSLKAWIPSEQERVNLIRFGFPFVFMKHTRQNVIQYYHRLYKK